MQSPTSPKSCLMCDFQLNELDYKNNALLQKFVSPYAKILPRGKTGTCARHQRTVTSTVKRARIMAFVPVTKK